MIENTKSYELLTDSARPLRAFFRKQLEGKALITTSTSKRFRREFCTHGLVLSSFGEILFEGDISTAIDWADQNLPKSDDESSDDNSFDMSRKFQNDESSVDSDDDYL